MAFARVIRTNGNSETSRKGIVRKAYHDTKVWTDEMIQDEIQEHHGARLEEKRLVNLMQLVAREEAKKAAEAANAS
jgi:hypothetical protein